MVAESDRRDIAAISSESCASLYHLHILGRDLQNSDVNYTMFYCITKEIEIVEGEIATYRLIQFKDYKWECPDPKLGG